VAGGFRNLPHNAVVDVRQSAVRVRAAAGYLRLSAVK
jgi:hypothetical protein